MLDDPALAGHPAGFQGVCTNVGVVCKADLPSQVAERVAEDIGPILQSRQPLPQAGRTDDIANGVLYLADDHAGFVTGVALPIDGGFAAGIHPGHREALWAPIRSTVGAVVERHTAEESNAAGR